MSALQAIGRDVADTIQELSCPICLSVATDAVVLQCGHLGCAEHIDDWLSRKAECPTCRAACENRPIKSHTIDNVMGRLTQLQASVEKAALDRVLARSSSTDGAAATAEEAKLPAVESIERLFRHHMRDALQTCSLYAAELQMERDAIVKRAKSKLDAIRAASKAGGAEESDATIHEAIVEHDTAVTAANERFNAMMKQLAGDVEAYLKESASPMKLMPATVVVSVPSAGIRFDVKLRPMDTINSAVKPEILKTFATRGLDQVTYGDGVIFHWESASSTPLLETEPVFKQCAKGRPDPAAVLVCSGPVRASSLRGSSCLVDVWSAGMKEDYFWCTTCALKWICNTCAKTCHTPLGHTVVPFLPNYIPTFACCYCRTRAAASCCVKPSAKAP